MSEANYCAGERKTADVECCADRRRRTGHRAAHVFRQDRIRSELQEAIQRNTIHVSTDGRGRRAGQRPVGIADGRLHVRSAVAHHGDGAPRFRQGRRHRARGGTGRCPTQQGRDDPVCRISVHVIRRTCRCRCRRASCSNRATVMVDGDSASIAELVALLSAIAERAGSTVAGRDRLGRPEAASCRRSAA